MPEESTTPNAVLVQCAVDAANARDIEGALSFFAPDAVWRGLDGELFEGHAAIRRLFEDWRAPYAEFESRTGAISTFADSVTLAVVLDRGRPHNSTGWIEYAITLVVLSRNGLIERVTHHADIGEARADAERLAEEWG